MLKSVGSEKALKTGKSFLKRYMPVFLYLAVFLLLGGGYLFCSISMAGKQSFLGTKTIDALSGLATFIAMIFLFLTLMAISTEEEKLGVRILRTVISMLPLCLVTEIITLVSPELLSIGKVSSVKWWLIWRIIAVVIFVLMSTLVVYAAVLNTAAKGLNKGVIGAFVMLMKHPLHYLLYMLMLIATFILSVSLHYLVVFYLTAYISFTFTVNIVLYIIESMMAAEMLYVTINYMKKKNSDWLTKAEVKNVQGMNNGGKGKFNIDGKNGKEMTGDSFFSKFTPVQLIISGMLLLADIILFIFVFHTDVPSARQSNLSEIKESISKSSAALFMGDLASAYENMQEAQVKISAVKAFIEENEYRLHELANQNPDEIMTWLYYTELTGDVSELESYIIEENPYHDDLRVLLLEKYSHMSGKEMTKQQKSYQAELLNYCISTQSFSSDLPKIIQSEKSKEKFIKTLDEQYGFVDGYTEALLYLMDTGRQGEIANVNGIIDIADRYPQEVTLQYLAGVISAGGATDNASHYESAKECVWRFVELSEADKKIKKDELQTRKLRAAELFVKIKGYEDAIELLGDIDTSKNRDLAEQIGMLKLYCADRSENDKECYRTAKELIEEGMDNAQVYYFYGIGALKQGKEEEMTQALERAAQLLCDEGIDGQALVNAETCFYIMLQYAVINDNTQWTEYSYKYYEEMSDKEKNKLSDFVYDYMEAMDAYYNQREYEYALEKIEDVLDERDNLSYALYLKGAILFSMKEFEDSAESYEQALEYNQDNPTFLYALANTYDAMENYDAAFEASAKVQELVPLINHEEDWYGLGYHNKPLYDGLKQKVGGEES